jgi:hypothetical protein
MENTNIRRNVGIIIMLGAVWGLSECMLGAALHACASSISGSVMTGVAFFFIAAAWAADRKALSAALIVAIAVLFKMFDAILLSLPLRNGTIANPVFAFILEGGAFIILAVILKEAWKRRTAGRAVWGGTAALISAAAFPLVRFATGTAACLVPGTTTPLAWYYAILAVGISLLTVPLGLRAGERMREHAKWAGLPVPAIAIALSLALMVLFRRL